MKYFQCQSEETGLNSTRNQNQWELNKGIQPFFFFLRTTTIVCRMDWYANEQHTVILLIRDYRNFVYWRYVGYLTKNKKHFYNTWTKCKDFKKTSLLPSFQIPDGFLSNKCFCSFCPSCINSKMSPVRTNVILIMVLTI